MNPNSTGQAQTFWAGQLSRMPGKYFCAWLCAVFCWFSQTAVLGDVEVGEREDVIELHDGTRVTCVIVMISKRGVLAVVQGEEGKEEPHQVFYPHEQVKNVTKGDDQGRTKGFKTDVERARKVVKAVGSGDEKEKKKKKGKDGPVMPTGPIQKAEPIVTEQNGETQETGQPFNSKFTAAELATAYAKRFPGLGKMANTYLGGPNKLQELFQKALKGNLTVRNQLERFLNILVENSNASQKPSEKPQPAGNPQRYRRPTTGNPKP